MIINVPTSPAGMLLNNLLTVMPPCLWQIVYQQPQNAIDCIN